MLSHHARCYPTSRLCFLPIPNSHCWTISSLLLLQRPEAPDAGMCKGSLMPSMACPAWPAVSTCHDEER